MTRSQFFKRLGLGALVCAIAPKMLAEKPQHIVTAIDPIKTMINQAKETPAGGFLLITDKSGTVWKLDGVNCEIVHQHPWAEVPVHTDPQTGNYKHELNFEVPFICVP